MEGNKQIKKFKLSNPINLLKILWIVWLQKINHKKNLTNLLNSQMIKDAVRGQEKVLLAI